jgi:hypothetical protein
MNFLKKRFSPRLDIEEMNKSIDKIVKEFIKIMEERHKNLYDRIVDGNFREDGNISSIKGLFSVLEREIQKLDEQTTITINTILQKYPHLSKDNIIMIKDNVFKQKLYLRKNLLNITQNGVINIVYSNKINNQTQDPDFSCKYLDKKSCPLNDTCYWKHSDILVDYHGTTELESKGCYDMNKKSIFETRSTTRNKRTITLDPVKEEDETSSGGNIKSKLKRKTKKKKVKKNKSKKKKYKDIIK